MSPADKWLSDNTREIIFCKRTYCRLTKQSCLDRQKMAIKKATSNGFTANGQYYYDACFGCPNGNLKSRSQTIQENVLFVIKKFGKLPVTKVILAMKRTQGDIYIKDVINTMIKDKVVKCDTRGTWRYIYL